MDTTPEVPKPDSPQALSEWTGLVSWLNYEVLPILMDGKSCRVTLHFGKNGDVKADLERYGVHIRQPGK